MTVEKIYISADELLLSSFRLAAAIHADGFRPDFIIGVWRGGTPVGIVVQEYLAYMGVDTDHFAIRTSSYTGIDRRDEWVKVHGLEYVLGNTGAGTRLLIVDDVFDTGRSMLTILDELRRIAGRDMPREIRTATPWYKPASNQTDMQPDYYLHTTDHWLVFPHELKGLTVEEIIQNKSLIADTVTSMLKGNGEGGDRT